jgi:hypothetical protein
LAAATLITSCAHQPPIRPAAPTVAATAAQPPAAPRPFWFEENRGQFSRGMTFGARLDGELLEIAPNAARFADVRMEIVGGNPASRLIPQEALPTRVSYFVGNDQSRWVSGAGTYSSVRYDDVYPGIDIVYHGKTDRLEYDFVVEPRQDPKAIRLAFPTAERLAVDADGSLVITSSTGEMRHHAPHAYQDRDGQRQIVAARFRVEEKSVSFELADYDRDLELVIDPVLSLSRFLSIGDYDTVRGVEVDAAGNIYVMGMAMLPPSPGLGVANSIGQSIYVAKYNPAGTSPIFIAYIGADWLYYDPHRRHDGWGDTSHNPGCVPGVRTPLHRKRS